MTADEIKQVLGLEPLEQEGGFFAETYRASTRLPAGTLPAHDGERALATAIYYLLTPDTFSAMHRVRSDEVFHFYMGDPVEMLQLHAGGRGRTVLMGHDIAAHQRPQLVVPAGVWQGTRIVQGGAWALLGTTVSPGFELDDYEHGARAALAEAWPEFREQIEALTRE